VIVLVGADAALLEGLAQLLANQGFRPLIAHDVADAVEMAHAKLPIAAVIERSLAIAEPAALHIPLSAHGALLLYRTDDAPPVPLPPSLARHVLADLTLPLERQRLLALVRTLSHRVHESECAPAAEPEDRAR
jgi:hypothetical protein